MRTGYWTDSDIGTATRVLGRHASVVAAAEDLGTIWGERITAKALAHALDQRGLGCPSDYLKSADVIDHRSTPQHTVAGLERLLVIPDLHAPYHDERAFELVIRAGELLKPDGIITIGDFNDFYAVSSHSKDPSRTSSLADEVKVAKQCRARLDSLGAKWKRFLKGNHEDRLDRYLAEKAPELFGTVNFDDIMELSANGWKITPYRQHFKFGKMFFTHDTGSAGASAHIKAGAQFEASVMIGHVHRLMASYFGNVEGGSHVAASCGWLGDKSKIDYMHAVSVSKDWQLGFATVFVEPSGTAHVGLVPIIDYSCVVMGQLVTG